MPDAGDKVAAFPALEREVGMQLSAAPSLSSIGGTAQVSTRDEFSSLWWNVYVPVALFVIAAVFGAIALAIVRSRRSRRREPNHKPDDNPKELAYVIVLAGILAGLYFFTFRTGQEVDELSADPGLTVQATGFQWGWRFRYPGVAESIGGTWRNPPELVLPAQTTVRIEGTSTDVIHSFFVPYLRFKRDLFPRQVARFDVRFDEPGTYAGHCAEFCGLEHARMDFSVRVLPPARFQAWLARRRAAA